MWFHTKVRGCSLFAIVADQWFWGLVIRFNLQNCPVSFGATAYPMTPCLLGQVSIHEGEFQPPLWWIILSSQIPDIGLFRNVCEVGLKKNPNKLLRHQTVLYLHQQLKPVTQLIAGMILPRN